MQMMPLNKYKKYVFMLFWMWNDFNIVTTGFYTIERGADRS